MKFALAIVALAACVPTQNAPRYGVVRVAFVPAAFDSDRIANFRLALTDANALGPTFILDTTGGTPDVLVDSFDSGRGCPLGAARYRGAGLVDIDTACTPGLLFQRAALIHELGHAIGMGHVCRYVGEVPNCSPVGYGAAVMNPSLGYGDPAGPTLDSVSTGPTPSWQPSELDLAEYRRVRP